MDLCALCRAVDFTKLPSLPLLQYESPSQLSRGLHAFLGTYRTHPEECVKSLNQPFGLPHHQSIDKLKAAAADCSMCYIIERGVSNSRIALSKAQLDEDYKLRLVDRQSEEPDFRLLLIQRLDRCAGFMVVSINYSPLSYVFPGRVIEKHSTSERTIARALDWVQECNIKHAGTRCVVASTQLPLRVLDVGFNQNSSDVQLYETDLKQDKYIALSHMWGINRHLTTTRSNIAAHGKGIVFDTLPKTFQDAVVLTRRLGIRYLWIDSLCICQDDGPDSERQSAEMASIYANAYLVFAATGSEGDSYGLFNQRLPPKYVCIDCSTNDGLDGTVQSFLIPPEAASLARDYCSLADEPLSKRGRTASRSTAVSTASTKTYPMALVNNEKYRVAPLWNAMLRLYQSRMLTKSSDKLPAVAGIARAIEEQTGDRYVAGLWCSQLIEGLLWQPGRRVKVPAEYRAPSWSWASADGGLGCARLLSHRGANDFADVAIVFDCHVELKGENPYGEVKSAWLTLRAPVEPLFPSEIEEEDYHDMRLRARTGHAWGSYSQFDTIDKNEASMLALSVVVLTHNGKELYQGLIITPVNEQQYRRVGMIVLSHEALGMYDWMEDDAKFATITLV